MINDNELNAISLVLLIVFMLIGYLIKDIPLGVCLYLILAIPYIYYLKYDKMKKEIIIFFPLSGILTYIAAILPFESGIKLYNLILMGSIIFLSTKMIQPIKDIINILKKN
ncbi:MAG: hypothetical protein WC376_05050 [Candidatus Nanoarchaeia archaeon]|jgi:hypothetical protein